MMKILASLLLCLSMTASAAAQAAPKAAAPLPDMDQDGIVDMDDKCPTVAENYNGVEDADGCPDKGRTIVTETHITIIEHVFFATKGMTISPAAEDILTAVADTLKNNPDITLQVSGHSDKAEGASGLKLSRQRAELVVAGLIKRGVPAEKLVTKGFGSTKPVSRSRSKAAQAKNRRVEFIILKRTGS